MRIAYITSMKHGLPSFVYRGIVALRELGVEPILFTTKQGKGTYMPPPMWKVYPLLKPVRILLGQVLSCIASPAAYIQLLYQALRTRSLVHFIAAMTYLPAMRRQNIELIYCEEALHSLFIGYFCHRMLDVPLLVIIHADGLYIGKKWPIFQQALDSCRRILTVSEYNRELLTDRFGVDPQRIRVVRLAVDSEAFCPDDRVSVLIVGQFAKRKGHDLLLRAVKQLNREDIVVWVVGEVTWGIGDFMDVHALVTELSLENQVIFFGRVSEPTLRTLYRTCDIFCLPSRMFIVSEGLPVSLMEAMASARPVISTRHTGIPELVPDILVEEEDVDGLSEAISYLADHPEVRREMGIRNRRIVEERFGEANVRQLCEILQSEAAPPTPDITYLKEGGN